MDRQRIAPVITLTTDFGISDHYVGTMKGVILSRCPDARLIDISHNVPMYSICAGAYTIAQAAPYFPQGTLHVVVVDPGVGTARKPILVEASGQFFIGPDNGVLSFPLRADRDREVREITNTSLFLPRVSSTFHGRDVFCAVAAALAAREVRLYDVGPSVDDPVLLEGMEPRPTDEHRWEGRIFSVDHFGNVVTNFVSERFLPAYIEVGGLTVMRNHRTFGEAEPGEIFLYPGSAGYVEIGMNQRSAADALNVRPGDPVFMRRLAPTPSPGD